MKYNFDEKVNRFGTRSLKWDYPEYFWAMNPNFRLDEDTIRLQIADMDFACAPAISRALHAAADYRVFGYTHMDADPRYRDSIVEWYRKRHQTEIVKDSIVYCQGALEGISQAIQAFTWPGDGVIVCKPVYSNFMETITQEDRRVVNCPLVNEDEYYFMDWELFENTCAQKDNRLFVLCSPVNPVGRVWKREELAQMAAICKKYDVVLVSDEIHSDLVWKDCKHIPIVKAAEDVEHIIMLSGPNKSFNLAGLQCAYAVIPNKNLRERFRKHFQVPEPNVFTTEATIAAYNEGEEWLDELLSYLEENLDYVMQFLADNLPKAKVRKPEGTYVIWVDISAYGLTESEMYERTEIQGNVFLQGGSGCDSERGSQYIRICLTCIRKDLERAMTIIADKIKGN